MRPPRVVESRLAFEPEAHGPPYGPHDANDLVCLLATAHVLDRHEVDHFADPLGAKKARQQHIAVGQVHLLVLGLVEAGDLEEASFALVENRGEDAWRVEVRQAAPVDRTVHAHQRYRVHVADDAVALDWLVGHFLTGLSQGGFEARSGSSSAFGAKISIPSCEHIRKAKPRCPPPGFASQTRPRGGTRAYRQNPAYRPS